MTTVYFVRHAQPDHSWQDNMTRPLSDEGKEDTARVLDYFKDKKLTAFIAVRT